MSWWNGVPSLVHVSHTMGTLPRVFHTTTCLSHEYVSFTQIEEDVDALMNEGDEDEGYVY